MSLIGKRSFGDSGCNERNVPIFEGIVRRVGSDNRVYELCGTVNFPEQNVDFLYMVVATSKKWCVFFRENGPPSSFQWMKCFAVP